MTNIHSHIGLIRRAKIIKVNTGLGTVRISLFMSNAELGAQLEYNVPIPGAWIGLEGQFIGGSPKVGQMVMAEQGSGGEWFIVGYIPQNNFQTNNTSILFSSAGRQVLGRNLLSALKEDRWLAQTKNDVRMFGDPNIGIQAGNSSNFIHINPIDNIISHNFFEQLSFTEASREIKGTVKRDIVSNSSRSITCSMLDSQTYDQSLNEIGMDPSLKPAITTSGRFIRNLPLVESREITYEFANSFGFIDDKSEATNYESPPTDIGTFVNRRESRADTLSLSLVYPNHLIETVKGTVVDVYGNILDLNRAALPIGEIKSLSLSSNADKSEAFNNIREQLRKSLAFHFEINARKNVAIPDLSSVDYARDRSRFFIDIDKEGQFKLNVPASSEVGNIPLLTRYENFNTLLAAQDSGNPNEFVKNTKGVDIYLESFAINPLIDLVSGAGVLDGYAAPIDRVSDKPIKFGTPFHDITSTIAARYSANPTSPYDNSNLLNSLFPYSRPIVSKKIVVSGKDANAGGRSGTLHLDGSLNVSVGANTIDRQSLWFDYAGGVVGNIGRDINNISYAVSMDGDLVVTVGGRPTVGIDSRFTSINNAVRSGAVDIRVLKDDGQQTIFRLDGAIGVSIATPGRVDIVAAQSIRIKSKANLLLDAEQIVLYADESGRGRVVNRTGQSI